VFLSPGRTQDTVGGVFLSPAPTQDAIGGVFLSPGRTQDAIGGVFLSPARTQVVLSLVGPSKSIHTASDDDLPVAGVYPSAVASSAGGESDSDVSSKQSGEPRKGDAENGGQKPAAATTAPELQEVKI
jgi:hypothetical protein